MDDSYCCWSTLLYGALCCLYIFIFDSKKYSRFVQLLFKVAPIAVLFYAVWNVHISNVAPFSVRGPYYASKIRKIVFGLGLSMVGDAYLVYPSMFVFGLIAFLLAQVFYFFSFAEDLLIDHIRTPELVLLSVIAIVSLVLYVYTTKCLSCGLKIASLFYTTIVSLMLWTALLQPMKFYTPAAMAGGIGALLFYTSDTMLGINKWRRRLPASDLLIMATYYAAQYLICYSTIMSA